MRRRWPVVAVVVVALAGCSDGSEGDLGAFCATAQRFAVDNPAAALDRYDPADPAAAAALLRDAAGRIDEWAGEAPSTVDEDVEVIAEAMRALAEDFESPAAAPASTLEARLTEVEAASGRVVDFTRQRCDVDLDPPTTVPAVTVPPAD